MLDGDLGDIQGVLNGNEESQTEVYKNFLELTDDFRAKDAKEPILGKLRDYLEEQVEKIAELEFKPKAISEQYSKKTGVRSRSVPPKGNEGC
jgi:hypothetical protein